MNPIICCRRACGRTDPLRTDRRVERGCAAAVLALLLLWVAPPLQAATRTWTGASGDGSWETPGNWSGGMLPTDQDDVVVPAGAIGQITISGPVTVRSLSNGGQLRLAGVFANNASLRLLADSTNTGSITLGTTRSDRSSSLSTAAGARLVNSPTGRIESVPDLGNDRRFDGTLVNQGLVSAAEYYLTVTGSYELAGGQNLGAVNLWNCDLRVTGSPNDPTEVRLYGDDTRLLSDNLPRVTLRLIADFTANGRMLVPGRVANSGAIQLESPRSDRTPRIAVDPAAVLDNTADGAIEIAAGVGGGRTFTGALNNRGTVHIAPGIALLIENTGRVFAQHGGVVNAEGPLVIAGGRIEILGGRLLGTVIGENTETLVGEGIITASELFLRGAGCTLVNLLSPAITLHLTTDFPNHVTLTTLPGAVNRGLMVLGSSRSDRHARLDCAAGLVNEAGATIEARVENGGFRTIAGTLVNRGLVSAMPGTVVTFTGDFELAGGRNNGEVNLLNAGLRITASPAVATDLLLYGDNTRLFTDNLPRVTLRAISDFPYNAQLLVPAGATNHGVIRLESPRGDRSTRLTIGEGATFENGEDGVCEVLRGNGGGRAINGQVVNRGRIRVEPGIHLDVNNAGAVFSQIAGEVEVGGSLNLNGGRLDLLGGLVTGAFGTVNAEHFVAETATQPQTVFVYGIESRLVNLLSPAVTLYLTTSFPHHTVLTTVANAQNAGRIVLGSSRGDRNTTLEAAAGLRNAPSGVIQVLRDNHGGRTLSGLVTNQGVITAPDDWGLAVFGEFEIAGGRNFGPIDLINAAVRVTASPPAPNEVRLLGDQSRLLTDNLPHVELRVISTFAYNARLTAAAGIVNRGAIRLDSERGDRTTTLAVADPGAPLMNGVGGRIEVLSGNSGGRAVTAAMVNDGTLVVRWPVSVSAANATHLNRGRLELDNTTATLSGASLVNEPSGIIAGAGTLDVRSSPFTNAGRLAPGASPGRLLIQGNYEQTATAAVALEIGGRTAGTEHDQIQIAAGAFTLAGGTLEIGQVNGWLPEVGDEVIVAFASAAGGGQFADYTGLAVATGISWEPVYSPTTVKLRAVAANNPPTAPLILQHPLDRAADVGERVTFTVTVNGTAPFTYQWLFNNAELPGANSAVLVLNNLERSQAGAYRVRIANAAGTVTSNPALLSVGGELVFRWDGGGDGLNWTDPRNWDTDRVPVPDALVVIDVAGEPTIELAGADLAVANVACAESFRLRDAVLRLRSGASEFSGPLVIEQALFAASQPGTRLTLSGPMTAAGMSLEAAAGATIALPGLGSYVAGDRSGANYFFRATGAGSLIDFNRITNLFGITGRFSGFNLEALAGGRLLFPRLVHLDDGFLRFTIEGAGSTVELPVLESVFGQATQVGRGGRFVAPRLTELISHSLTVSEDGQFPDASIRMLDASSVYAERGAQLTFPLVTAYVGPTQPVSPVLRAYGVGSRLDLPALAHITGASAAFHEVVLESGQGGVLLAPRVTRFDSGNFYVAATGAGSVTDLGGLASAASTAFVEQDGGRILLPALAEETDCTMIFTNGGSRTLEFLRALRNGRLTADNTTVNLPLLQDTAGSQLEVRNGGQLNVPLAADLQVLDVAAPPAAVAGQPVVVSWIITNLIATPITGSRRDGFALRQAGQPDLSLGTVEVDGALPGNGARSYSATIIIPGNLTGPWRFVVTADAGGAVFEGGREDNNALEDDATIVISSPDLVVPSITLPGGSIVTGNPLPLQWTVKNQGTAPASNGWSDAIYLSASPTDFSEAIELGRVPGAGPLLPGASHVNQATVIPPLLSSLPAGAYYLGVRADALGTQFEGNEGNNWIITNLVLSLPPLPDLTVENVQAPATAIPGRTVTVTYEVRNLGAQTARGPWRETVLAVSPTSSPQTLASQVVTIDLPAPGQVQRQVSFPIPPTFINGLDWCAFQVVIDTDDDLVEEHEDNNAGNTVHQTAVPLALTLLVPQPRVRENQTPPTIPAQLIRSGDASQSLTATLYWPDTNRLTAPVTLRFAPGETSTTFPLTVKPDGLAGPDVTVTITTDAPGYVSGTALVTIVNTDVPALSLKFAAPTCTEGQTAAATLTRNARRDEPLTVTFRSDSPQRFVAPAPVTLPAGAASVQVLFLAADDSLLDPLQTYTGSAGAPGFSDAADVISVIDNDIPTLTLMLANPSVSEAAGAMATVGTVQRGGPTQAPLLVALSSSSSNTAVVPVNVLIPAGEAAATFSIGAVDNAAVDGPRSVDVSASATLTATGEPVGAPATQTLAVTDDDGPDLTLRLERHLVGEGLNPATTATLRINTGIETNLVVTLASNDPSEATVPPTVTIPAHVTEVRFNVASVADGTADGSQTVVITARTTGFTDGVDQLVVSDLHKPDLLVTQVTAPPSGLTRAQASIGWQVKNQGLAEAKGTFRQALYLSTDNQLDADDPLVADQELEGQLPPEVAFSFARTLFLPRDPGVYWVFVRTDAGNAFDETLENNNVGIAGVPIRVEAAFFAEVSVALDVGRAGEPVEIRGRAFRTGTRDPAPFEVVAIHITHQGTKRVLGALTQADGSFSTLFRPGLTEAGFYDVAAGHPEAENLPVQDQFTLIGLVTEPRSVAASATVGQTVQGSLVLRNLGPVALSGLLAEFIGLPAGVTGQAIPPASLGPQATDALNYILTGIETNLVQCRTCRLDGFTLRVTSANGAAAETPFALEVLPNLPQIEVTPSEIVAGMVRGRQSTLQLTVRNVGAAPTGPLSLALPEAPWLASATVLPAPSLAPGESTVLGLLLNPGPELPLTVYRGEIGVVAEAATTRVPFSFRAVSEAVGDLEVVVEDEYTYYVAGEPRVAGALVQLLDPFDSSPVREAVTGANGQTAFANVPEGTYLLRVTAAKHTRRELRVDIAAGVTRTERVLLPSETVTYRWNVVPTEIPDRYRFTIDSTFEANVPFPKVTSDPFLMPVVFPGEVTQTSITLTNHGLIAAKDLKVRVRSTRTYLITPLFSEIGDLPAKSSITIPIFVQHQPDVDRRMLDRLNEIGRGGGQRSAPGMAFGGTGHPPTRILTTAERAKLEADGVLPTATGPATARQAVGLTGPVLAGPGGGAPGGDDDCELPELEVLYFVICGPGGTWYLVSIDLRPITMLQDLEECLKAIAEAFAEGPIGIPGVICDCASSVASVLGGEVPKELECLCAFLSLDPIGMAECICPSLPTGAAGRGGGGGALNVEAVGFPGGDGICSLPILASARGGTRVELAGAGGGAEASGGSRRAGLHGDPGICARVKLRIEQDLVLTRAAFTGTLEVENRLATSLSQIGFQIDFFDAQGRKVNERFGIHPPRLLGLSAVDGTGSLPGQTTGSAEFTLVPAVDAAPEGETPYSVGGELRYLSEAGEVVINLLPVPIRVRPQPRLFVDYFHQRDVFSDDPHTEELEPSQPYTLAVMLRNVGKGAAWNVSIASAQPKIIENMKGLLIDFQIVGAEVFEPTGQRQLTPALTADFGNLDAGETKIGRWLLKSTLQGLFIDYEARFEHLDGLGQKNLSLIDPDHVLIHELTRLVRDPRTGADPLPDFLVNEDFDVDPDDLPDTLYLSTGAIEPVNIVTAASADAAPQPDDLRVELTAALPSGWTYLRVPDPQDAVGKPAYLLTAVRRSDGAALPVENFWQTDRTFIGQGKRPIRENVLHLLDYDSTGRYTLVYTPVAPADTTAPSSQIAALPPQAFDEFPVRWTGADREGGALTFDVYVSADGGSFAPWLRGTGLTSALFKGTRGHAYAFYSVATDLAGNREAAPATPDAMTTTTQINSAPELVGVPEQFVTEGQIFALQLGASDPDLPAQSLTFLLAPGAPNGLTLDPVTGWLRWSTGEGNGPATYPVTVFVRDNGAPALTDSTTFNLTVREENSAPSLAPIPDISIREGALLQFTATATDADMPQNTLTFMLGPDRPRGAAIDPLTGVFTWRPTEFDGPSSNRVTVTVADNGAPPLTASRDFTVLVRDTQSDFRLALGSTHLRAGQSDAVPVRLVSGVELSRLDFRLRSPSPALTGLRLEPVAPEIDSAVLQPQGGDDYQVTCFVTTGAFLDGDRDIARIAFDTAADRSALAQLLPSNVAALGADGTTVLRGQGDPGNVFVVLREPVLHARPGVRLVIYGLPGTTYSLEVADRPDGSRPWQELRRINLGDSFLDEALPPAENTRFLRVREVP